MGGVKGAELAFAWSVKYLVLVIFRSRLLAKLVGSALTTIMRPFAYMLSKSSLYDLTAVYFIGVKSDDNKKIKHKDLIKLYKGNRLISN